MSEREDEVVEVTRYSQMGGAMVAGHDTFTGAPVGSWIKYEDYIATIADLKAKCERAEQDYKALQADLERQTTNEQLQMERAIRAERNLAIANETIIYHDQLAVDYRDLLVAAEAKCVELEKDAARLNAIEEHWLMLSWSFSGGCEVILSGLKNLQGRSDNPIASVRFRGENLRAAIDAALPQLSDTQRDG